MKHKLIFKIDCITNNKTKRYWKFKASNTFLCCDDDLSRGAPEGDADKAECHGCAAEPVEGGEAFLEEDGGADDAEEQYACVIEGEEQGGVDAVIDQRGEQDDGGGGAKRAEHQKQQGRGGLLEIREEFLFTIEQSQGKIEHA